MDPVEDYVRKLEAEADSYESVAHALRAHAAAVRDRGNPATATVEQHRDHTQTNAALGECLRLADSTTRELNQSVGAMDRWSLVKLRYAT